MKFTFDDLRGRYERMTASIVCSCDFATELVGGQPADDSGLRAYVQHQLKIEDPDEIERAVARINDEEIGERPVAWEWAEGGNGTGEIAEKETYGVHVIRRTERGPFLLSHMVQACIKQAASRLKLTIEYRGAKGNIGEAGRVFASGVSLVDKDRPERIYLIAPDGSPAATYWKDFRGRVNTPQGAKSIIHHSECAPPETRFEFEFRFLLGEMTSDDIADMVAMAMNQGIGSARSLGCGRFRMQTADFEEVRVGKRKKKAEASA